MRIAHIAAEVAPFAKTGGLGDVVGALPIALAELGHEVSVWMPLYRQVRAELEKRKISVEQALLPFRVVSGPLLEEVGVLRAFLPGSKVPIFFVGSDRFFDRPSIYHHDIHGNDDGISAYAVLVRAAIEAMRRLELVPDVLHSHDWHTALAPMLLRWDRPEGFPAATVHTIHNLAYQGLYSMSRFGVLGLPRHVRAGVEWGGALNLMKGALSTAGAITGVSPTFVTEMMSEAGGFGLDPMVRDRAGGVFGILNGIDPRVWNPAVDTKIPATYDANSLEKKVISRRALLTRAGMDPDDRGFVVGAVGRLTPQKGYDLLFPSLEALIADGIRFVMVGSGEDRYEQSLHLASARWPRRFWGYVGFSDDLAHLVEAGADAFLMPSRFEPCGLNQMYSLAYGTPPIVRLTGGLADTVIGYDGGNRIEANGFVFDAAEPVAVRETIRWAARAYRDMGLWTRIVKNGMKADHSWRRSANEYVTLYNRVKGAA